MRAGQATRRTFTTEYKLRVVAEYEAAPHGEKGAVLRREKLYDTQVSEWRQQAAAGTLGRGGGRPTKTGRPAATADQKRVRELELQLIKAEAEIVQKDQVIADRDAALEVLGKGVAFLEALTSKNAR
jgi:transposase-like protein